MKIYVLYREGGYDSYDEFITFWSSKPTVSTLTDFLIDHHFVGNDHEINRIPSLLKDMDKGHTGPTVNFGVSGYLYLTTYDEGKY